MVGAGEAAGAKTGSLQPKIAPVFLDHHIGSNLGGAKHTVKRAIDGLVLVDSLLRIFMDWMYLPTQLLLGERKRIRRVTIDFIGRGENESGLRAELAGRFQQDQGAGGVYRKIRQWLARRPVMGRLRRRMNY